MKKNGFSPLTITVYENKAKPAFIYKKLTWKNRLNIILKNFSASISNCPFFSRFMLGDREIMICRKDLSFSGRRKARLLFLHPTLGVGGAEQNRLSVLKNISRNKYDITLCCLTGKGKIAEELESCGYKVDCLRHSDRSFNLLATLALYRYIKKNKFDIVHTCLSNTNLHGRLAAKLAGVPIIISEEQSEYERYNAAFGVFFRLINHCLSGFTDKIIVCSEKTGRVIAKEEKIPSARLSVLYNCIDCAEFKAKKTKEDVLRELGLSGQELLIGYVASLAHRKGHEYLLQAFKLVVESFSEARLILVGEGYLKNKLISQIEKYNLPGKVIFLGQRRDIPDILQVLKIFVSPALSEAFGIVLIEAMYMALPCVATKVGGVPEVIKDGRTGILVPPRDAKALYEAIKLLLDNPETAQKFGESGRQRVLENFTAKSYARRLQVLYDGFLEEKVYKTNNNNF